MHRVKKAEYLDGYKIKLQFNNGKTKIVDLEEFLKKSKNKFRDLLDLEYFKKVECDGVSIIWPNEIDFCPDLLYMKGKDLEATVAKSKKSGLRKKRVVRKRKSSSNQVH